MFGMDIFKNPNRIIEATLDTMRQVIDKPIKFTSVLAQQERLKAYLSWYGLVSKEELERNPAALVRMNQAEDSYYGSVYEDRMDEYLDLEIFNATGVGWEEFIAKPRAEIERMIRAVQRYRTRNNTGMGATMDDINRIVKAMKKAEGKNGNQNPPVRHPNPQ